MIEEKKNNSNIKKYSNINNASSTFSFSNPVAISLHFYIYDIRIGKYLLTRNLKG